MSSNPLRTSKSRRAALAGGAAIVLTAAAAGMVSAQQSAAGTTTDTLSAAPDLAAVPDLAAATPDAAAPPSDVLFATAAAAPGTPDGKGVVVFGQATTPAELTQRRDDWLKSVAGKLGVSTDKLQQAIQDANKESGLPAPMLTPPMIGGGMPGTFAVRVMSPFQPAAQAIGITEDQLRTEQAAGKSLADVARAHNVDPTRVADAMKAQRRSEIDKAVSDGVMPKDAADKIKSHIDEEIDHLMTAVPTVSADGKTTVQFQFTQGAKP